MVKPITELSAGSKTPAADAHPAPLSRGVSLAGGDGNGAGWSRASSAGCGIRAGEGLARKMQSHCIKHAPLLLPLPRQQLKSFLPKLSQYWHIAASVEVLTLMEGAQWVF